MRKKVLPIFIFLFVILSLSLVVAQPPFEALDTTDGLAIEVPITDYLQQYQDFKFHVHVQNSSNGVPMYSSNGEEECFLHLYNTTGSHLVESEMGADGNGVDYDLRVLGGNFSVPGQYAVVIWCNNSFQGDFLEFPIMVTPTGEEQKSILNNPVVLILLILAVTLVIIGVYFRVPAIGFLGAILFLLAGMYVLIYGFNSVTNLYTRGSGITIIALGMFFMIVSAYEWFGGND